MRGKSSGVKALAFFGMLLVTHALQAQFSAREPVRMPTLETSLSVQVYERDGTQVYRVPKAFICVGDVSDTRRYGSTQTLSGASAFSGVPMGTELVITAYNELRGNQTNPIKTIGARITHTMRAPRESVDVVWDYWTEGVSCATPTRSKELSTTPRVPELFGTLRVYPATPLIRTRRITLATSAGSPPWLDVTGTPTHYRVSQNSGLSGASWAPAEVRATPGSTDRMTLVPHEITGEDGRKTVYLQLRNAVGTSPIYQTKLDFLDLYTCKLRYRRADNALAQSGNMAHENLSALRAQSKTLDVAWPSANESKPGYGMHLRWARNEGDHPIELTVGGGSLWNKVTLPPGNYRLFRADLRAVRCP